MREEERQKKEKARGSEVSSSAAPVEAGMLGSEGKALPALLCRSAQRGGLNKGVGLKHTFSLSCSHSLVGFMSEHGDCAPGS